MLGPFVETECPPLEVPEQAARFTEPAPYAIGAHLHGHVWVQLVNGIGDIDDIGIDDIVAHAARWEIGPLAERRATRLLERMSERLDTAVALTIDAGADPNDTAAVAQTIAERLSHMT